MSSEKTITILNLENMATIEVGLDKEVEEEKSITGEDEGEPGHSCQPA